MNTERWQRIHCLTEQALAQPEEARRTFLDSACGQDIELRDEVVSLLAACERSPEMPELPTGWSGLVAGPAPPRLAPAIRSPTATAYGSCLAGAG